MKMKLAALALLSAWATTSACSQHVFSPPTQAYMLAPVTTLAPHGKALDVEASSHQQIFDPGVGAASARLRTGLGDDLEVSGEAMVASVANVDFYTGRAALRVNPGKGAVSFNTGIGGGYAPKGGEFLALDAGFAVGYDNCYVVPVASAAAFVSQPIDAKPIDVSVDSNRMYSTARRTAGSVVRVGLRVSLSPAKCHAGKEVPWITAGFDETTVVDATDHDFLFGFGVGVSLPL
ncbi:hypothetical protein BH11MYX1_BH11MYX1_43990 [soil metagenome]